MSSVSGGRGPSCHQPVSLRLLNGRPLPETLRILHYLCTSLIKIIIIKTSPASCPDLGDQPEDEVVPVPDVLRSPQHQVVLLVEAEQEGEVTLPVGQTHPAHVTQPDLENEGINVLSSQPKMLRLVLKNDLISHHCW